MERSILLLIAALFLFVTPVTLSWAHAGSAWYLPYILWLILIVWCAWGQIRASRHDV